MSEENPPRSRLWDQVFPGLGIGLLVGLLVGLSVSPVVSGLLTTLGGLLAAILGIQTQGENGASRFQVNGARIGAFGLACVLGVLAGMTLRVKDVLAVPLDKQVATWVQAGFDPKEARQFVALLKTGVGVAEPGAGNSGPAAGDLQKSRMSALFNAFGGVDLCEKVGLDQYGSDPKLSAGRMLEVYHRLDLGDSTDRHTPLYKRMDSFATRIEKLPPETQFEVLKGVEEMVCAIQAIK